MSEQLAGTRITYVGHATVLYETVAQSIIADPVFSNRLASIFTRRETPMNFDMDSISNLKAILVSHGHHDHMDLRSLVALGKDIPVIVPRGVSLPLVLRRFKDIRVMRPWDEVEIGHMTIAVVPSHHFGGRPPFYVTAGYQGYVASERKCIYFAGDTGFDEKMFKEIGGRFALDLAVLPIGAYHPPSFRKHHMSPEDAVEAFRLLCAKSMMPIHFETFSMSWEPIDEPRRRLGMAAESAGVADRVFALHSGESICLDEGNARRCERIVTSKGPS